MLNDDIQKAIANNLPALFANELKVFIEQANKTETALADYKKLYADLEIKHNVLKSELSTHRELDKKEAALAESALDLQRRELELKGNNAELRAVVAEARLAGVELTMDKFLKNVVVRSNTISNVGLLSEGHPPSQNNSYGTPPAIIQTNNSHHVTESKE